jgi:hypothetical protein
MAGRVPAERRQPVIRRHPPARRGSMTRGSSERAPAARARRDRSAPPSVRGHGPPPDADPASGTPASTMTSAGGDADVGIDAGTGPGTDADRGAVTVEAALALCSLVLFLALAVGAITAVGASIRCADAARELARLGARGEPDRGHQVAIRLAPAGAVVSLSYEGDLLVAEVSAAVLKPLPLQVGGRAVAAIEPGVHGA